jgi:predicted PurR-regulated permease PerM
VIINIITFLKFVLHTLEPFIFGFFIAYFLNPLVNYLEFNVCNSFTRLQKNKKFQQHTRLLSVSLTYFIFVFAIIWFFIYLIPQTTDSVNKLILICKHAVNYSYKDQKFDRLLILYNKNFKTNYSTNDVVEFMLKPFLYGIESLPDIAKNIISHTFNFASILLNIILGAVIAFYMLCDKNNILEFAKKIVCIVFNKRCNDIIRSLGEYNSIFQKFFIGKTIDSIIIGALFFISCKIINAPYALLISMIIGITNMIPYFGPFIGAIPVVLIVFMDNAMLSVWIAIIICVLQQFDGIILGPKILGDSTGLKPMAIIFSITIGGAFFGVSGMFLGVPVFAIITKIINSLVENKYNEVSKKN